VKAEPNSQTYYSRRNFAKYYRGNSRRETCSLRNTTDSSLSLGQPQQNKAVLNNERRMMLNAELNSVYAT